VNFWNKPRTWIIAGVAVLGLFLLYQLWVWEVERIEVKPGEFLVKIDLWGKDLPEGEIVAPSPDYKGIQKEVLPEGRHFLNPLFYRFKRVEILDIPSGKCAVLTHKAGTDIAADRQARGEFLVEKDESGQLTERGIVREVLLPGLHRLNPYVYSYELLPMTKVAANQVGVKTLRWGKNPRELADWVKQGRVLSREKDMARLAKWLEGNVQDADLRRALLDEKDADARLKRWLAATISDGSLRDWVKGRIEDPNEGGYVVYDGYRGVQHRPVPPGDYYLNPYVEQVVPVDIDLHQVEFSDITFPSLDGFTIQPHVRVAYKVIPAKAPELFVQLSDEGVLSQADKTPADQKKNPILQKFVLPLIRGWVRIEGSKYPASDYVSQQKKKDAASAVNPREELRKILESEVKQQCREAGVMIESIAVGELEMNKDLTKLAEQIFQRESTLATRDKNADLVLQYKSEAEQKGKEALSEQRSKLVDANRDLKVAKTKALQQKEVEEAKLKNEMKSAQARLEAAKEQAKATITRGKADAAITIAQNEAEVSGLKTAVAGFPTPDYFAQYHVLTKMSPSLSEIFASDDSEIAKMFTRYMSPAKKDSNGVPRGTDVKK
jgi:hypothetical protein